MTITLQIKDKEVEVYFDRDHTIGAIYVNGILADGRPGHKNPEHRFAVKHTGQITEEAEYQYDERIRFGSWLTEMGI